MRTKSPIKTSVEPYILCEKQKDNIKKAFQLTEKEIDILINLNKKYRDNSRALLNALLPN